MNLIYQSNIVGENASETWTAYVLQPNGTPYQESFTHSTMIPLGFNESMRSGTTVESWKIPKSDKSSFRSIVKSGLIKMTDYDVGKVEITNHIVSINRDAFKFITRGAYTLQNSTTFFDRDSHLFDLRAPYSIRGDLSSLRKTFSFAPYRSLDESHLDELESLRAQCKEEVIGELNSSYDLLTELGELRETLEMFKSLWSSALHPLQTIGNLMKRATGKSKKNELYSSAWMQFRYGIMPVIYSLKDILSTLDRIKHVYHTERAFRPFEKHVTSASGDESQFYEVLEIKARITAVAKLEASTNRMLRLVDSISINPFKTAWELIPLSFVVDWFINVGDVIEGLTGSLLNFSNQREFCHATKFDAVRTICYRDNYDDRALLSTGPWTIPNVGDVFPRSTKQVGYVRNSDYVLQSKTESSYIRRKFSPSDVDLRSDVFLSWKRWIDGFVLSLGNTKRLFRAIK